VPVAVSKHGDKVGIWSACEPWDGYDATSNDTVPRSIGWWFQFTRLCRHWWRHKQAGSSFYVYPFVLVNSSLSTAVLSILSLRCMAF